MANEQDTMTQLSR